MNPLRFMGAMWLAIGVFGFATLADLPTEPSAARFVSNFLFVLAGAFLISRKDGIEK